jgi:hypothetical protein
MKKVKISIAAIALVLAIAGTATANANSTDADPCIKVDPKHQVCNGDTEEPCCEEEGGIIYFYPAIR